MNPSILGNIGLVLAVFFSVAGLVAVVFSWFLRDARYVRVARRSALLAFLGTFVAFGALEWALLSDDFSIAYTARNHTSASPTWVKFATLWAALEGSILLWALLQTLYTWLAGRRMRDYWTSPVALGTLFVIQLFFLVNVLFVINPFTPVPNPPADGPGPNPLLQNHWMMAVHPILMYLGFVGLSVPFAYAIAAMVTRRYQTWVGETKWWLIFAWGFLTAAIFAGGWWSYEVLGWGGYWAWDPVENASFIPWLLATAFVHTAMVQERRGLFRSWNFALVTLAFAGTVFGTFLTRSGVIESVHAFAGGPVGPIFLGFLLVILAVGFSLLGRVSSEVRDVGSVNVWSREGLLLFGALVFVVMAFVVILGTLFPLLVEATSGAKVSVGAPFFNQLFVPLGYAMLVLMALGPLLPWRRADPETLRVIAWMAVSLVLGTAVGLAVGWTLWVSLTVGLFLFNLVALGWLVASPLARKSRALGGVRAGMGSLAWTRRRYGGYLVHFAVALTALAIAFSQSYRLDVQKTLQIGEAWQVAGRTITVHALRAVEDPHRYSVIADVEISGMGLRQPRLNYYPTSRTPFASPSVAYTLGKDYYLVLQAFDQENAQWVTLRLVVTPLVLWLWVAAVLMALGTAMILWPARRTARAGAAAGEVGA
ncbi:heme lyase CcmF/NrfE family subunit [Oceanithermus desulfurans]|uniref:Cytochrome c biogenesis protein CcmF n=2 Tax=Oceanithermus desulfurans TaxID=227924 RepID=A0A511RIG4_9DEIN|nr:heme lyase CcmF/NrfE family subunit [Oceanithermus desulfurans]MBB6030683.1 cytochrome c-type biogenesis protein CcmF [Oceanithermus desulfurans]GEM89438.1 cytochrome c biogenesis protein CcmF [Oceanithermus desulfurans NBRC 100063]